jgi:regulator of protease activity HflC (stomatin/prohibitin superfamily)
MSTSEVTGTSILFIWKHKKAIALLLVLIIGSLGLFPFCFGTVDVGSAVILEDPILKTLSSDPILGPSFYLKLPWAKAVTIMYAVESVSMLTAQGDYPSIIVLSEDGLQIAVDVQVRWSLNPSRLVDLYRNYPALNWKDLVVASVIRETVRDTIANYSAIEVIEERQNITRAIVELLKSTLLSESTLAGAVMNNTLEVDLRNINPPVEFLKAITAKLTAQQKAIEAEYNRTQILILANATAQQGIIIAQGEAQQKLIQAKAQAYAQAVIANATADAIGRIVATNNLDPEKTAQLYITMQGLIEIAKTNDRLILILDKLLASFVIPES